MTFPVANEPHFETLEATPIVNISLQVILFCIGLFAQIKIIKVCKGERNKTWQIHIFHAITMTIVFASKIILMAIGYILPSLFITIGSWICHLILFVFLYGFISIASNTFIIASMKFVFTVHTMKAIAFGESRIQKIIFWANLLFPFILLLDAPLYDFQHYGYIGKCFHPELWTNSTIENIQSKRMYTMHAKKVTEIDLEDPQFAIHIKLVMIIFRALWFVIVACNFTEGLIYYKIFKGMKR